MLRPHLLYYGDDFTGATDTLATAARAGLRSLLLLAPPDSARLEAMAADDALRGLDCLGIAGVSRSLTPQAMREELAPIAALARRLQPTVLHYKTCSTFDSAPGVGSIGEAVRVLAPSMPGEWTAVLGGQPNLGRYCLFGNLFAAAGTGGEVFRIDRHPTMSRHPVTPMLEADLRRHLGAQGLTDIGLVPWTTPPAFLSGCLDALRRDGARTVRDGIVPIIGPIDNFLFDDNRLPLRVLQTRRAIAEQDPSLTSTIQPEPIDVSSQGHRADPIALQQAAREAHARARRHYRRVWGLPMYLRARYLKF